MKHHILTIVLSLLLLVSSITLASAQDQVLQASNSEKSKSRDFKAGRTMKIMTTASTDEYSKVRLEKITDTLLTFTVLDEEESMLMEVKPADIVSIKKPTCLHNVGYAVGSLFFLAGSFTALSAPSIAGYDTASDGEVAAVRIAGLAGVALGVAPFLIKQAEYNVNDGWTFKVAKQQ